jgi:hypothetical protein
MGGPSKAQGLAVIGILLEVHSASASNIKLVPMGIL